MSAWSNSLSRKEHHCHHHSNTGLVAMLSSAGLRGLEHSPPTVTPSKRPLYPMLDPLDESGDSEIADDGTTGAAGSGSEKKRRLTVEQVRSLEISFETENRLEPVRKMQLAQELGLQPRQVAVWFQNRRARWKTKQLERDYDVLKSAYESLVEENNKLKAQLERLTKASDNDENMNNNQEEVEESRALEKANLAGVKSSGLVEDEEACCTTPESPTVVSSKFKDSPLSSSDGYNSDVLDAFSPHLAPRVYEKSRLAPQAVDDVPSVKEEPFPYKLDEELQPLDDQVPYNCLFEEEQGNWAWWEWS